MKMIKIALALVFLCGFGDALPDVGHCSFMEYFCNVRRCITLFYKDLQKDASAVCGVKYRVMIECARNVLHDCVKGTRSEKHEDSILSAGFQRVNYCVKGLFGLPESSSGPGFSCSNTYPQKASLCGETFHQKFVTDWSDPSLCSEFAKAKECARDLLESECTVNPSTKETLYLFLGDYNPYCASNRDSAATGSDQCHGYLPASKSDVISVKPIVLLIFLGLFLVVV